MGWIELHDDNIAQRWGAWIQQPLRGNSVAYLANLEVHAAVFHLHEPQIDLIDSPDILIQYFTVRVFAHSGFVVAALQVVDDLKQFIYLGVHHPQVGYEPDFIDSKIAISRRLF